MSAYFVWQIFEHHFSLLPTQYHAFWILTYKSAVFLDSLSLELVPLSRGVHHIEPLSVFNFGPETFELNYEQVGIDWRHVLSLLFSVVAGRQFKVANGSF